MIAFFFFPPGMRTYNWYVVRKVKEMIAFVYFLPGMRAYNWYVVRKVKEMIAFFYYLPGMAYVKTYVHPFTCVFICCVWYILEFSRFLFGRERYVCVKQ